MCIRRCSRPSLLTLHLNLSIHRIRVDYLRCTMLSSYSLTAQSHPNDAPLMDSVYLPAGLQCFVRIRIGGTVSGSSVGAFAYLLYVVPVIVPGFLCRILFGIKRRIYRVRARNKTRRRTTAPAIPLSSHFSQREKDDDIGIKKYTW